MNKMAWLGVGFFASVLVGAFGFAAGTAAAAGNVIHTHYDGVTNDLLTAGLGKTGLAGAPPGFVDPVHPTAEELRRSAIYNNYRALVDITSAGGRRCRPPAGHHDGAGAGYVRSDQRLHRHGAVVRLTRRLRRHCDRGRVGA